MLTQFFTLRLRITRDAAHRASPENKHAKGKAKSVVPDIASTRFPLRKGKPFASYSLVACFIFSATAIFLHTAQSCAVGSSA